jgi:hypothetical protein
LKRFVDGDRWDSPIFYADAVIEACLGRYFFSTVSGWIGLGPAEQVGDSVYTHSGRTPYILRKDKESGIYSLLGESYVHGFMYGEVPEMRDQGKVEERHFVIT